MVPSKYCAALFICLVLIIANASLSKAYTSALYGGQEILVNGGPLTSPNGWTNLGVYCAVGWPCAWWLWHDDDFDAHLDVGEQWMMSFAYEMHPDACYLRMQERRQSGVAGL